VQGAQGAGGSTGAQGSAGSNGSTGAQGATGSGAQGASGATIDNTERTLARLSFTGVGGNSNVVFGSDHYSMGQASGSWSYPYPDLIIGYHTGIRIGGYWNYGGTRFYNNSPTSNGGAEAELMSIGNGDNHVRVANNLYVSTNGTTGGGIILADDGDIVDMNDAYCAMRFSSGVRIYSANRGGSPVITLHANGNVYASALIDSNDSGYYCDPNGTNRLNFINSNNHYIQPACMLYSDHGSWTGEYNKIQWHGGNLYFQNNGGGYLAIFRRGDGGERAWIDYNGNFTASGNVTAYSDRRLKENIQTIPNALSLVQRLRGVTFDWIADKKHSYGLIAQEVEEVIPELVLESENGTAEGDEKRIIKSVDYSKIVSVLIEAIKELKQEVNSLKQQVK
jgi:hypothetical protein